MTADGALVQLYVPVEKRAAFAALFAVNDALGDVLRSTSNPMVGRIRLAWWRERLEELDQGAIPAEPRLKEAARLLLPAGISGADLGELETGWAHLLEPFPWPDLSAEATWFRGLRLFGFGARLLDRSDEQIQAAGGLWALVDAARHCSDAPSRELMIERAHHFSKAVAGRRFARPLRPLSMLAALALRDLGRWPGIEPEGTPGRALTLLRHRLTGQL
ncbi:MAG: squalene/phytoene synthase family protein [Pseudomonadota bacterium]